MMLEPGRDMAAYGGGHMRASTADRDRALDVLKAAFAEGRLTKDEFDERAEYVYRSRTYAELGALTADLPVGPLGALEWQQPVMPVPRFVPAGPARTGVNALAVASLICALIPGVPGIGAIVAGVIARRQIRETGERGVGLATAGIVIGSLSMLLILLYLLAVFLQ
jgi:hypothetical protein